MRLWKNATKMQLGLLALCAGVLVASVPGSAQAQLPELIPGGVWVVDGPMGEPTVGPGRSITWMVTGTNLQPTPLTAKVTTEPHNVECEPGGSNTEYGVDGGIDENAPQSYLSFIDNNADGDCNDPGESIVADMGAPTLCLMMAPSGQQRLEFNNLTVPAFGPFDLQWITDVSDMAMPPQKVCSWAHIANPMTGELIQSTRPPGSGPMGVPGCSCVDIGADQGIDGTVTKTGTPDSLPLIPGDPNSTIVYEIIVTNTGAQDIVGATLVDSFMPDNFLEWTEVLTCDAPLMCSDITADPTTLTVTGWNLNPLEMDGTCAPGNTCVQTVIARAAVTCAAATDDDTGEVCNQGDFQLMGGITFPTDDPDTPIEGDPTCTSVIFSNLTESIKTFVDFVDGDGNGQLDMGEVVNFRVTARNTGRLTATNVIVTDDLSTAGCWLPGSIDASASGGVVTGDAIEWQIGDLAPGASMALDFSVTIDSNSLCCNQAFLQSDEREACGLVGTIPTDDPTTLTDDDETCASPGPQPVLGINKEWCLVPEPAGGCPGTAVLGSQILWTVTITNSGTGPATGAEFVDDFNLSGGCTPNFNGTVDGMTSDPGGDWGDASGSTGDTGGFPRDFGTASVTSLGGADGIQPGETVTLTFQTGNQFSVEGCCNQAFVSFNERAEAQGSDDPGTIGLPQDPTCLNVVPRTEGLLEKAAQTLDVAGGAPDGFISIGDEVEYTFTFSNIGSTQMTNVAITDMPPSCVTIDSASIVVVQDDTGTFVDSSAGGNVDVSIATIDPAQVVIFTVRGTVAEVIIGCCNQAAWTSDQAPDGEGLSDRDTSDFAPEQETCFDSTDVPMPQLQWVKSSDDGGGCNAPGTTVNYTLTITNNGTGSVDIWDIVDDVVPFGGCANVTPVAPLTCDAGTDTLVVDSTTEGPVDAGGGVQQFLYSVMLPCDAAGGTEDPNGDFNYDDGSGGTITLGDVAGGVEWGWPDLSTSGKVFNWDAGDMNGDGRINPGTAENEFSYTINVNNSGSCEATGVVVTDTYPASYVVTDPGTGVDDGTTITWNLGTIAAGGSAQVTFVAMIDEVDPPAPGDIPNTFSVTADNDGSACMGGLPDPGLADEPESTGGVPWDIVVVPSAEILRNAFVSCRAEATSVYDLIFSGGMEPQIDAAGTGTTSISDPVSPVVYAGDADIAVTLGACPQVGAADPELDRRVLVFYEYSSDPVVTISVSKNGADVEVSW